MLSGNKISGVLFRIQDGASHSVDSSDYAFAAAAEGAMRQCCENGKWSIMEPIMNVETTAPEEFKTSVISDLSKKSAVISSVNSSDGWFILNCEV